MSSRLVAVAFDARDPGAVGAFWARLLGREPVEEPDGVLVPGDAGQVSLRFVAAGTAKREENRLHLHVTSTTEQEQRGIVDAVLRSGGQRRGSGPLPFGHDLSLRDAGGDEFCAIAPGNAYLAGCGPLGEVTCEGTRAAGRFWRDALGWRTVWDDGPQIAIQSPQGGTKISWDGAADPDAPGWNRQRFDLAAADPDAELDRLVALGATPLRDENGSRVLADPDASEFTLRSRFIV